MRWASVLHGRWPHRRCCRACLQEVLRALNAKGISILVATKHLAAEEAPESYKDVDEVVETCHKAGISRKVSGGAAAKGG